VIAITTFLPTDVDKAFNSQRKVVSFSSFVNQTSEQSGRDY
jgi:hypothetical protein